MDENELDVLANDVIIDEEQNEEIIGSKVNIAYDGEDVTSLTSKCNDDILEEQDHENLEYADVPVEVKDKKDYRGQFDHVLCDKKTGVYVKLNADGFVTEVGSDVFIENLDGWIKIDEGEGDRFVHAQSQYYDTPITDEFGHYKYKLK